MLVAEEGLRKLDLSEGPLGPSSPAPAPAAAAEPTVGTVRQSTVRRASSLARSGSVRSNGSPCASLASKKPLQPDMSFGNSRPTMRLFRRVPSNGSTSGQLGTPASPVEPYGKEAVLGRRFYAKAVEPTLAELHAQTSALHKREALAKLSDAFAALDAVDPEGAYHLVGNLVAAVAQDSKLSAALLRQKMLDEGTPRDIVVVKSSTPVSGGSPTKLVLSANNPHLRSHRRRQSDSPASKLGDKDLDDKRAALLEDKYPGREARVGMEHCKQLSDVLYQRWADNLRIRWPAV